MEYVITTFYKFLPLETDSLIDRKNSLLAQAEAQGVFGLILIAPEGINATIAGFAEDIAQYKDFLIQEYGEMVFKDSTSDYMPFRRMKVKIKEEIVQLSRTDIQPTGRESHISPEAWDAMVENGEMMLIDVRNAYETKIGTFKQAIDPKTDTFKQFPDWLKESQIPKHQKIGIFCTGGIRCEKAAVAMKEQGYENVHQLDGGILNYIEKRPNKNFEGECFVFDHRVSVGQDLKPSKKYKMCRDCGNSGELTASCERCDAAFSICDECQAKATHILCSRQCKYEFARGNTRVKS